MLKLNLENAPQIPDLLAFFGVFIDAMLGPPYYRLQFSAVGSRDLHAISDQCDVGPVVGRVCEPRA
ncbi:hypothetical protein [Burkholderia sp. Ac-20379]|uniref:hypothetical protein n=1 Tax=Burkholderia sp. Ac-20379 TaxID=2703900 RepID=UPI00197FE7EA|nr:hypothetical protein [Burkholderia sp. Ac-20379]MBN3724330.1 hypothetical protein [Burkholderia sp. Ac-20379]